MDMKALRMAAMQKLKKQQSEVVGEGGVMVGDKAAMSVDVIVFKENVVGNSANRAW
jgi:hypothetical protein